MSGQRTALLEAVAAASEARDREVAASPGRRRAEGIVHTPPALARFVAVQADLALRDRLGLALGLADRRVGLVDPAVGTGAFLAAAFDVAGARPSAPAVCLGYDLDDAALDASRRALSAAFAARGWPLALERVDTLGAEPSPRAEITVVLGNPPWAARSGSSARAASDRLLADFRRDERGEPLGERKSGVLSDDYVRFFRWGAEVVRRSRGGGVLALVTNGSFLDGPVHRAMRAALLRWFGWVDVVDLGGSALVAREGAAESGAERDENVFAVRPKVAVTIATRPRGHGELLPSADVRLARMRGSRAAKLERLGAPLESAPLELTAPLYVFTRGSGARFPASAVPFPVLFPFHREGVQTNRDEVAIAEDREALLGRLRAFVSGAPGECGRAGEALRHYDPERAREAIARALEADPDGTRGICVRPIAYRPYDVRYFAPVAPLCHRPRPDLLAAMDRSRFALLTVRKDRGERAWLHFAASAHVPDNCFLSTRSSCRTRAFPTHDPQGAPNVDLEAARALFGDVLADVGVEAALDYALGLLASARYRERYGELLLRDYPRVVAPESAAGFEKVRAAGAAVRAAFLAPGDPAGHAIAIGHHRVERAPEALRRALAAVE